MAIAALDYIDVDDRGVARIAGTRMKVEHIVLAQRAEGYTPEQLREAYDHLSMAQIHAALAYYHAHKDEIDRQIEEGFRFAEEMRAKSRNLYTREELERRFAEIKAASVGSAATRPAAGDERSDVV